MDKEWINALKLADFNHDGKLDFHEFLTSATDKKKLATESNLQAIFDEFDMDKDGNITIDEFRMTLPDYKESAEATRRRTTLKKVNAENRKKLLRFGGTLGTSINENEDDGFGNLLKAYTSNETKIQEDAESDLEHWKRIIDRLDKNGDGKVNYEEFKEGIMTFIR